VAWVDPLRAAGFEVLGVAARLSAADVYATTGLGHRRVARNPHVIRYAIDFIDPS
jgi:hypothetical protein